LKNYYEILEVSQDSSQEDIKKAYRALTKKYHPDRNPEGEEHFKKIVEAYETLSDSNKKAVYDRNLNGGPSNEYFSFQDISFGTRDSSHLNVTLDRKFSLGELMSGVEFTVEYQVSKSGLDKSSFDNKTYKIRVDLSKSMYPFTKIGANDAIVLRVKGGGSSQVFERTDFFGKNRQTSMVGDLIVRVLIDTQGVRLEDFNLIQSTNLSLYDVLFANEIILENPLGKKYRIKSLSVNNLSDIKVRIPEQGLCMPNGSRGAFIFEIKVNKPDFTTWSDENISTFKELLKDFDK
jgi:DnaJ-class molecular chaperone